MNDRWNKIEKLYYAALERYENERAPFLQEACAGDEQLRREVESLLAQEKSGSSLLERPALEVAAKMIGEDRGKAFIGRKLGGYEIQSLLGAGGMGEVYKARDTKLRRDVAIKVIPAPFAKDPERIVRFRREAQLLASLNHPSIAAIYGLEEVDGATCLVMELVLGETLSERIRRGAVPVEESLTIGKQIAEALEAAHEKGVIHRDLKPANVKVTPEGKVKVLDFGLAKAFGDGNEQTASEAPTMITAGNQPGRILGTPPYMSPEQASGKTVDKRTDIWAFGCVLYELLTGKQAFAGTSVTDILGAVLHKEPDWSALPPVTPPAIRTLLRRCLQKDARERFRDAGDIRIQIEEARAASSAVAAPVSLQAPMPSTRRWLMIGALACLLFGVVIGIAVWTSLKLVPDSSPKLITQFTLPLGAGEQLYFGPLGYEPALTLSPDGKKLAYTTARAAGLPQLYLRSMDGLEAKSVPGTEEASYPIFSPDGQWLAFLATQTLKKVSITGGAPLVLKTRNFASPSGLTWGANDAIAFAYSDISGLYRIPASGGTPQVLTVLKGENSHRWPEFLPDGKAVIYTNWITGPDTSQIIAQQLATGERRVVVQGGSFPRYVPTGHLIFVRAGNLMAVPFDPVRLEAISAPVLVAEGVMQTVGGAGQFTFSNSGTLAYVPGGVQETPHQLVWVDRRGKEETLAAPLRAYLQPVLSPEGHRIAVLLQGDIWIFDIARGTLSRLTFSGANQRPLWTPDGKRVAYFSSKNGPPNVFWKSADGTGVEEQLTESGSVGNPSSFSPEMTLAFVENHPDTKRDIYVVPLNGDRKPRPFIQTPFDDTVPEFSPDGRWMAYLSNESGRWEVYVQPYPGPGGKWQISTDGGEQPVWNPNGRELFYRNGDKQMAVEITTQPAFSASTPKLLFEGRYEKVNGPGPNYTISPDGLRFLMVKASEQPQAAATQINVVLNWFEELKKKVLTGK